MASNSPVEIDYQSIELPDEKEEPMEDWHYTRRRAWLYRAIVNRGGSQLISRTKVAKRFDKTPSQISQDIKIIEKYLAENMDQNRFFSTVKSHFDKRYTQLMKQDKEEEALKLLQWYGGMLEKAGVIEHIDRSELTVDGSGISINIEKVDGDD